MPIDTQYVILGVIFICAVLLIEGVYYLVQDTTTTRSAANRRMKMLASGTDPREIYSILRRRSRDQFKKFGPLERPIEAYDTAVQQSGYSLPLSRALLLMLVLSVLLILGFLYLVNRLGTLPPVVANPAFSIVLGTILGIAIPYFLFKHLAKRRMQKFTEQLPDALDIMVRSLQAGHPVASAMGLVTKEMRDPIGTEFGIAVDEMTYGLDLRDALENLGRRVDHEAAQDFQYVLVSINIQHDTGGNLAETLSGLSRVIRERFQMFKKIRVLSAEGRLSAKILAGLPPLFVLFMITSKPAFYTEVIEDPLFWPIVGVAILLQIIGMYIMHKLVNFRV